MNFTSNLNLRNLLFIPETRHSRIIVEIPNWNGDILTHGLYFKHVQHWLKYFPREQFLFVNGEQLRREPSIEMNKLQTFLNLNQMILKKHFVFNESKGFHCVINPLNETNVVCMGEDKGRKHPVIDLSLLNKMRSFFRSSNRNFFKLINVETPWWPI